MLTRKHSISIIVLLSMACSPGRPEVEYHPGPEDVPSSLGGLACHPHTENSECCSNDLFPIIGFCLDKVEPYIDASVELANSDGLVYSLECMERMISEKPKCAMISSTGNLLPCEIDCQIFFGTVEAGAPCEAVGFHMSDCQQGLLCGADRVCHDPCDTPLVAPEDGFCGPVRGMWFVECDAGLACDAAGRCVLAQPLGAACDSMSPCAAGTWCQPSTASCIAQAPAGDPCTHDDECQSRVCSEGACYQPESPECGRWAW